MVNNTINRFKFFGQYFGQDVFYNSLGQPVKGLDIFRMEHAAWNYAELTSLSDISEEDAIEASKVWGTKVLSNVLGHILVSRILDLDSQGPMRNIIGVADFLRSKGYLVPFNGLSCDEIISRGWAKIKTK